MPHTCTWQVIAYTLLSLPRNDFGDRAVTWACACGRFVTMTGDVRMGTPLATPAFWEAQQRITDEQQRRARFALSGREKDTHDGVSDPPLLAG